MLFVVSAALATPSDPDCFASVPLDADITSAGFAEGANFFSGAGQTPRFVIGYLSYLRDAALEGEAPWGTVVAVWNGSGWSAVLPYRGQSSVADLAAADGSFVVFVTQHQVEGPGPEFTIVRSDDGLRTATCTVLPFPRALNRPSYATETLAEPWIELDGEGRGRLVAHAEIDLDTDTPRTTWWAYRTRDGGRTWSAPKSLRTATVPDEALRVPPVLTPADPALLATIRLPEAP